MRREEKILGGKMPHIPPPPPPLRPPLSKSADTNGDNSIPSKLKEIYSSYRSSKKKLFRQRWKLCCSGEVATDGDEGRAKE